MFELAPTHRRRVLIVSERRYAPLYYAAMPSPRPRHLALLSATRALCVVVVCVYPAVEVTRRRYGAAAQLPTRDIARARGAFHVSRSRLWATLSHKYSPSHREVRATALAAKLAFAEAGLWDHILNLVARSQALNVAYGALTRASLSSPLESASALLRSLTADSAATLGAAVASCMSWRPGVGAFIVVVVCVAVALVTAPLILAVVLA